MKYVKYILLASSIIMTLFIWINSFKNGIDSSNQSDVINDVVVEVIENVTNKPVNPEKTGFAIRKYAHYFEFMLCAFLYALTLFNFKNKYFALISLGLITLVASFDEFIQLFRSGRNSSINDVFLDLAGAVIGIYIVFIYNKKRKILN